MKKKLFKILFGLCIFMFGTVVNAEVSNNYEDMPSGVGEDSQSVVIGNVETPVYNVNIYWSDLTFDWVYDEATEGFGWAPANVCTPWSYLSEEEYNGLLENGAQLFTDDTCSTSATGHSDETKYYVLEERENVFFNIEDYSKYGQIVPSIEWNAESNYSYVDAVFKVRPEMCIAVDKEEYYNAALEYGKGLYSDSNCSTSATDEGYEDNKYFTIVRHDKSTYTELTTKEIPDSVRESAAGIEKLVGDYFFESSATLENNYRIVFTLENTTAPTSTPSVGDKVGTITVSLKAK